MASPSLVGVAVVVGAAMYAYKRAAANKKKNKEQQQQKVARLESV